MLKNSYSFWFLFAISILFFLLRFPSLYEPYWYGDEGIYQVIGKGLHAGRELYVGVWDNKPPLLYFVYALFQADQFQVRFMSLVFGIGASIMFYFLSRLLFPRFRIIAITTGVFALLFALPSIEGNIANAENFMLLPAIAAGYFVFSARTEPWGSSAFLPLVSAGMLLALSFLFKVVGLFDTLAFITFLFFVTFLPVTKLSLKNSKRTLPLFVRSVFPLAIGFFLPVLFSLLYFLFRGTLSYYIDAVLSRNIDYVGWGNQFLFPQGFLILKLITLAAFISVLFVKRHLFSERTLFILIWVGFALFSAFLSQRPYTHYQLVLLPSFSLSVGLLFIRQRQVKRMLAGVFVAVVFLLAYHNFYHWDIPKTYAYYDNFVQFISNKKDLESYQRFFDTRTPRDYAIAQYIKQRTEPNDVILLWGNSAQIYALSDTLPPGRFSAAYHIRNPSRNTAETAQAMQKTQPKYIIIMPDEGTIPFDLREYAYRASIEDTDIYERL